MSRRPRAAYLAEPPARYVVRTPVVVDSSMMCAILFDEPERAEAEKLLAGKRLLAPWLLDHEVLSVALKKARRGLPEQVVASALADYAEQQIELMDTDLLAQYALARDLALSAYDAAYLALAVQTKTALATFDHRLGEAARRLLGSLD